MHSYTDSFDSAQESECPLCTEEFDMTDKNLKPCKCGYQVCLWCLNRLMETSNGDTAKCPNCRRPYDQKNFDFKPLDAKEIKAERSKQKSKKRPQKSRKSLTNVRVIQRNLVYVVGLTLEVAKEGFLGSNENFAKYGKISKLVVNTTNLQRAASQGREPTVSAYITYERPEDAAKAIQAVDSTWIDGKMLRASFGTTKYCAYFLRNIQCTNPDCMYLHEYGHDEDTFTKDDIVLRNGLPTPNSTNDGYLEIYSALKDTSNVVKHHWNYPRSNQPPNARPGNGSTTATSAVISGFENTSFWDVPEDEGGEYEGYEGEYYDDEYLHESNANDTPTPPEPKPKVAIANANKKKSDSSLPSTARWGIQAEETPTKADTIQSTIISSPTQSTSATLQQDTLQAVSPSSTKQPSTPKAQNSTKASKKQKKKDKKGKKGKKSPQQSKKNEPKRGPVTIQEPQFDKPKKTTTTTQASNISNDLSKNSAGKKKDTTDNTPISSLKQLNAESTPLPIAQNSSPSSSTTNKSPLDTGLFGRSDDKTFPSLSGTPTGLGATQQPPSLHQQDQQHLQQHPQQQDGKLTSPQTGPFGAMFSHHHEQHSSTTMSGHMFMPPNGSDVPQLGSVPSLWSSSPSMGGAAPMDQQQENHLTQSRFAFSSDGDKTGQESSEAHSRFAPPAFAHQEMQDTLRSLLPNVKVNFSFGGAAGGSGTSAGEKTQQPPLLQPHQGATWGAPHPNININIHNNFIQNTSVRNGFGYDAYAQSWGNYSANNQQQQQQQQQQQHQPSFFHS